MCFIAMATQSIDVVEQQVVGPQALFVWRMQPNR